MKAFRFLAAVCAGLFLAVTAIAGCPCASGSAPTASAVTVVSGGHYEQMRTKGRFGRVKTQNVWVSHGTPVTSTVATTTVQTVYPSAYVQTLPPPQPTADNITLTKPLPTGNGGNLGPSVTVRYFRFNAKTGQFEPCDECNQAPAKK